jgi:alkylation response protein AidB-like acyl-CoA dehydrogenase
MNYFSLTQEQQQWKDNVAALAEKEIAPRAEEYDRLAKFPQESLDALRDAGLLGLRVSKEHGGLGADFLTTCLVVEEIAKKCPSTAMCYKMHLESVEAVSRIPTALQVEKFVRPLAQKKIFAAAPGGESRGQSGTDWRPVSAPETPLKIVDGGFVLNNLRKSYVTSAGHADLYLMFCRVEGGRTEGPPDLLIIEADKIEWQTVGEWDGLGMRGNSSTPMIFNGVVPQENLLGLELEGEEEPVMQKYMSPVLILTYGAAYLGIASGAFELACIEGDKRFVSGSRRFDNPINKRRISEMSAQIESARAFLHTAASMADEGRAESLLPYIQAKVICSEVAVRVTQDLMTIFGGTAYARQLPFERYFRDARAGLIMGMANDQAYEIIGDHLFPDAASK